MTELKRYSVDAEINANDFIEPFLRVDAAGDVVLYTDAMESIRQARNEAYESVAQIVGGDTCWMLAGVPERKDLAQAIRALKSEAEE